MKTADAVDLLTDDHLQVSALFKQYEKLAKKKAPADAAAHARRYDLRHAEDAHDDRGRDLLSGGAQGADRGRPARRGRHRACLGQGPDRADRVRQSRPTTTTTPRSRCSASTSPTTSSRSTPRCSRSAAARGMDLVALRARMASAQGRARLGRGGAGRRRRADADGRLGRVARHPFAHQRLAVLGEEPMKTEPLCRGVARALRPPRSASSTGRSARAKPRPSPRTSTTSSAPGRCSPRTRPTSSPSR